MAKATVQLTNSWQQIATGAVTITISDMIGNNKQVAFNETASDTDALLFAPLPTDQFYQDESKPTYAKGVGVTVITDSAG